MVILRSLITVAVVSVACPASAHVSVSPTTAVSESYQVLRFGVGHGCDGKATTALRIELPVSIRTARPQPKSGWSLRTEHLAGDPEVVSAIIWTGKLAPDRFDEFLILAKLPGTAGKLAFPAVQSCEALQNRWVEVGTSGSPRPPHPAPILEIAPAALPPEAASQHQH